MAKSTKEKRLKRYRSNPTQKIRERIERAVTQRLFLVEASEPSECPFYGGPKIVLTVLGSTGNVYKVTLAKVPSCDCPDARKGNLCKHFLFVMLKVVGLSSSSPLVYQAAYLTEELEEVVGQLRARTGQLGRSVVANEDVQTMYAAMKSGESVKLEEDSKAVARKEITGDCPVCFDELGTIDSRLTYCKHTCGTNFHADCIKIWSQQLCRQGATATCPACRQPWDGPEKKTKSPGKSEGYDNLGGLQGQSPDRDTSTYHSPSYYYGSYKRRRYY
mmetsp:Transcript_20437/g.46190  ORF Transcript_20437/g.46190 Transcript_20437/m.46190 type:complete len:274 (+) Transcript_20437:145-966(+)